MQQTPPPSPVLSVPSPLLAAFTYPNHLNTGRSWFEGSKHHQVPSVILVKVNPNDQVQAGWCGKCARVVLCQRGAVLGIPAGMWNVSRHPGLPGCTSNTHPGIAQPLFWNGSFGWCLCRRKMQEARSALQCCTSGLYKPRCYPESSSLKPSNSALASAPKQISALTLHQGTDQTADLQTRVFASTLS